LKSYNSFGEIIEESNYVNGKQIGKNKLWHKLDRVKDGQLTEKDFVDTLGTGYGIVWNERGEIKSEGSYKTYLQDGEWIFYPWHSVVLYEMGRYIKQIKAGKRD